jgi:hypothetical protein
VSNEAAQWVGPDASAGTFTFDKFRYVGDPHQVTDALVEELVDIRRAAGLPDKLTAVDTAMAPAPAVF